MSRTCIVIPCYNEASRLDGAAFLRFTRGAPDVRLLFIDDGSTDDTAAVLERLCAERPDQLELVRLDLNRGKAEAVRVGMLRAIKTGARYAGYWDADLATPLDVIATFIARLEESPWLELVMGSRVQLLGRRIERRPARHYLGRIFATTASLALGLRVYDTQCGAKLFRVTPMTAGLFERPFTSRWIFDVEILARMVQRHRPGGQGGAERVILEEPLVEWADVAGSKLKARSFAGAFLDLTRIAVALRVARSGGVGMEAGAGGRADAEETASGASTGTAAWAEAEGAEVARVQARR